MPGLIPQAFIDDLIARVDIVELIGRRLRLKRQGSEFAALCPFHEEKTPSFTVSPRKQFFHCFGCGAHGTALGFLMRFEHLDFVQAVERLADELGLEVPREGGGEVNRNAPLYEALARAQQFYAAELARSARARDYVAKRGLTREAVETFGIGYAPANGEELGKTLAKAGVDEKTALAAGLLSSGRRGNFDRFRDRLMLPIRDSRGRTVAFGGRTLGDATPKYLNSPETPVFHKGRMLYGLYEARQKERRLDRLVVVEGYLDVISLALAGFGGAVATLGTSVTEAQVQLMFRTGAETLYFCFDGDAAGERAAWRALEQTLPALVPGRTVRFAFLPPGEDPDSLVRAGGIAALEAVLAEARPLSAYLFDTLAAGGLAGAEGRARFAGAFKPLIERVRDPVFREALTAEAAERLGLPVERLAGLIERRRPAPAARKAPPARPVRAGQLDRRVARALQLALAAPGAVAAEAWPEGLEGLEIDGFALLVEIVETVRTRPHLTTAGLLEQWREHPEAVLLGELAARERLIEDDEAVAADFREALRSLAEAGREAEIRRLEEAAAARDLDAAELERLRNLLAERTC